METLKKDIGSPKASSGGKQKTSSHTMRKEFKLMILNIYIIELVQKGASHEVTESGEHIVNIGSIRTFKEIEGEGNHFFYQRGEKPSQIFKIAVAYNKDSIEEVINSCAKWEEKKPKAEEEEEEEEKRKSREPKAENSHSAVPYIILFNGVDLCSINNVYQLATEFEHLIGVLWVNAAIHPELSTLYYKHLSAVKNEENKILKEKLKSKLGLQEKQSEASEFMTYVINNAKELEDKLEREREKNLALQIKIAMMQQNEEKIKKLKEKCRLLKLKK